MIFVLIFIKMKEESVRHREMENQRHREVSTLKKQTRKNESKIKSLEAEKRMKELALKRKNEEVTMGSKFLSIHICILYTGGRNVWGFWLETRVIIKISSHPWYPRTFDWFSWGWSKNGRLKKSEFFEITNSQYVFVKILRVGPWLCRIDWRQGHWCGSTYMVMMLSGISAKTA